ncbi:Amidophosphoribosyltransferase precursor [Gemella morbillorum]|jgi:amidophosphoribosyltransferase|uniref:Amidophosphoribosyltransferase n=2 Tax=Gemella morbillorum TaxID=29391 RepID=A0A2X4N485_9BACL|nr:amidophosphoribosyltransferase [Gemella morbillorum]EFV36211.1 amidophosphoribosyltransferase [Gemella morbillorum M424]MBF1211959.1 amidophosphoribosyltransferase [Gemella morbillorum]MDK8255193.1 amidophosphoribosyltransferase [Gemella morbillorum]QGS09509.1 amidophosphoribosyltransferase [Gemella morbillorum]UBH79965.1 amidophosphoribosyltransferase [Gemella morbillorum]
MRGLNEECGVFGIWGHPEASNVTYFGLHSLQHRGQEGGGIVSNDKEVLRGHRDLGLISEVFRDKKKLENLLGSSAIGHVRYATSGSNNIQNIQPFLFHFYDMSVGICHNGNLINAKTLRRELEQDGAIFHSSSDTEVLIHLIRRSKEKGFKAQLKDALCKIKGGFTYLVLTKDTMYGAVDPNSLRPLAIGKMKNGAYVAASETCAIDVVGAEFVCNVGAGELVIIDDKGIRIEKYTEDTKVAIAAMEYVYFARPDSNIAGVNVHTARKRTGRRLAIEQPAPDADMVIGVPNSSLSAASGYAEESGLPYEMGLIKNQYVARTFIQPTQELREQGVRMKLSAVKGVVSGKSIVLVDDSIVRGTTSKRIVQLLKEAGAREVHVRISAPPLIFPSFYGIDISTTEELIAANKTQDEICEIIGADSLGYLSEDGLIESIGLDYDAPYTGLCMDCFNGDYSAGLYDYEEDYLKSMTNIQKKFLQERGKNNE